MLAAHSRGELTQERAFHERTHRHGAQQALNERRAPRTRWMERHGAGGGLQFLRAHQPINEPDREGLVGARGFAGQHELHRLPHA